MSFSKFVFKSSFRKRSRTIFTLIGITIPIIVILFFGMSMALMNDTNYKPDSDIHIMGVFKGNIGGPPLVDDEMVNELKDENGVENVVGVYSTAFISDNISIPVLGLNSSDSDFMKIKVFDGRMFNDNEKELVLSKKELKILDKSLNDSLLVGNETYNIVGITDNPNGGAYTSLKNVQNISSNDKKLNQINVKVKSGENVTKIGEEIQNKHDNITLYSEEGVNNLTNMIFIIFRVVPMIIAIILTLVFMMKSVNDRKREIGLLKAIGWKTRRVFMLIISETLILSICSFIIGSLITILGEFLIEIYISHSKLNFISFLESLDLNTFLTTFGIVLIVALLAGLLPAIRASRLSPTEALREE
ncbi:MAG: ABC transporter permease [Methanobrevibacter sp.]|jgi:putative ABC transport system permease protein|nr:ABC transporter permease [Candidatus Methanovirga basalitermitum]